MPGFYFRKYGTFIFQIDQRFSNFNLDIMHSVQACSPQSDNFLHINTLTLLHYGFQYNRIEIEATLVKSIISQQGEELTSIAVSSSVSSHSSQACPTY